MELENRVHVVSSQETKGQDCSTQALKPVSDTNMDLDISRKKKKKKRGKFDPDKNMQDMDKGSDHKDSGDMHKSVSKELGSSDTDTVKMEGVQADAIYKSQSGPEAWDFDPNSKKKKNKGKKKVVFDKPAEVDDEGPTENPSVGTEEELGEREHYHQVCLDPEHIYIDIKWLLRMETNQKGIKAAKAA